MKKAMNRPLASIIMPNYNDGIFLKESLSAIFNQSFKNFELIFIDDNSQDDSLDIINIYQQKHSNIFLLKNKINKGIEFTVNKGIKYARGKYLIFCAADDKVLPNFLKKQIDFLESNDKIALCVSDPSFFYEDKIERYNLMSFDGSLVLTPSETVKLMRKTKFWIPSHSTIYRKESIIKYGKYHPSLECYSDWFLNLKIALNEKIGYLSGTFAAMRLRKDSYSFCKKGGKENIILLDNLMKLIKKEPIDFMQKIKQSGLLTQLGNSSLFFLISHYEYWNFMPSWLRKKLRNVFFKIFDK